MRPDSPEDYYARHRSAGELRRSPTGRVPQWVLDEAAGRPVQAVPFRGPATSLPSRRGGGGDGRIRNITIFVSVIVVLAAAYVFHVPGTSAPKAVRGVAAATSARDAPPPGREEASGPLGVPPLAPAAAEGSGFRFMRHQPGSPTPMKWSPCRPIHYVIRLDNAPVGGAHLLTTAIAAVSQATGLQFINDGATTEGPSEDRQPFQASRYGNRWAPVLIAWATAQEVPDFGTDIAGEAGPFGISTPSGDSTYISGTVYLDPHKVAAANITSSSAGLGAEIIVLHELGHLVGLAHVDDPSQVMYPRSSTTLPGYGQGDRAGLAALGHGPCQPDI